MQGELASASVFALPSTRDGVNEYTRHHQRFVSILNVPPLMSMRHYSQTHIKESREPLLIISLLPLIHCSLQLFGSLLNASVDLEILCNLNPSKRSYLYFKIYNILCVTKFVFSLITRVCYEFSRIN